MKAINVYPRLFGGPMRAGDLIAACNFLEYLRNTTGELNLKLYIPSQSIQPSEHCKIMRNYLKLHTDYIVTEEDNFDNSELLQLQVTPGTDPSYLDMYNLFNIREDVLTPRQNIFTIPDAVKIRNDNPIKRKIVIVPLMDADYNFERNWSLHFLQTMIDDFHILENTSKKQYDEYIIASKNVIPGLNIWNFTYSHDYETNLNHIAECSTYVGGDTGLSHFAGALVNRPDCLFYYSKDTYGTTNPFYWKSKGEMIYY